MTFASTPRFLAALLLLGGLSGCPLADDDDTTIEDDDDATGDDDDATGDDDDATGDDDDSAGDDDDATGDDDDSAGDDDDSAGDDDDATAAVDTVIFDFDNSDPSYTDFGGNASSTVVDPTDSSNMVGQFIKTANAELWAGTTLWACPAESIAQMPLTATETMVSLDVWSPDAGIVVKVKAEDSNDVTLTVESEVTVQNAAAWETVTIDFANVSAGTNPYDPSTSFDKISVFFNFGVSGGDAGGEKTYFADNLTFLGTVYSTDCPVAPVTTGLPITFDDPASAYAFAGFGGASGATIADPMGGGDDVMELVKGGNAELWAGVTVFTGPNQSILPIPLAVGDLEVTVEVWSPAASVPIRIKVEDSTDSTRSVETEAITATSSAWETLTFDFGSQVAGTAAFDASYTYDKISVFPNFGTTGANGGDGTWYVDNIEMAP